MQLLHFKLFQQFTHLQAFVTTRHGGISQAPFDSLNLSYAVADSPTNVATNRQLLATHLGIEVTQYCIPQQTHSNTVQVVTKNDIGKGSNPTMPIIAATDGLITNEKNICLMVFSADCVLTLLYDVANQVIAATHGGWRGTSQGIVPKAVAQMKAAFGTKPEQLVVGIAPAIRACCYEVGEEVITAFRQNINIDDNLMTLNPQTKKYHLDLHKATRLQLEAIGVLPQQIETKEICTYCAAASFFSSRHGKGITGRFAAGILLK